MDKEEKEDICNDIIRTASSYVELSSQLDHIIFQTESNETLKLQQQDLENISLRLEIFLKIQDNFSAHFNITIFSNGQCIWLNRTDEWTHWSVPECAHKVNFENYGEEFGTFHFQIAKNLRDNEYHHFLQDNEHLTVIS